MPTQAISIGPATPILQNVVYALPAKASVLTTTLACEVSLDGIAWTAFTSGGTTGAKFVRCTTGNATIVCSAMSTSGGSNVGASSTFTDFVAIGTAPASTGALRVSNNFEMKYKNAALVEKRMFQMVGNNLEIGDNVNILSTVIKGGLTAESTLVAQGAVVLNTSFGYISMTEKSGAGPAVGDAVSIWAEDNGSGKTRLMARFGTGANVQIAIEP